MNFKINILLLFFPFIGFAQSDFERVIKAGEVLLSGLSILKVSKSDTKSDNKTISSICVKNKLSEKINFKIMGIDENGAEIKKEMVIQNDGKECVFNILKGIYSYEVSLANNDTYKKGEYRFDDDIVIMIKKED